MIKGLNVRKSALAIAAGAAALGVHMFSMAQTNASLNMTGQIAAPTCLIAMQRTNGGSFNLETATTQTYSFGAVDVTAWPIYGAMAGITLDIFLRDSDGVSNCALVSNRWDIGLGIKSTDLVYAPSVDVNYIKNQSKATGAAKNIGLFVFAGPKGTNIFANGTNLGNADPRFGVSLANNGGVGVTAGQAISVSFNLAKTAAGYTPGAFSVALPLNIWYR